MSPFAQAIFLETLKKTGLPLKAMEATGLPIDEVIKFLSTNPNFTKNTKHAALSYKESIISEVHRRGVLGWDEPVFFKGEPMYHFCPETGQKVPTVIRRYDSALLQMEARRVEAGYRTSSDGIIQDRSPTHDINILDDNHQDDNVMRIEFVPSGTIPEEDRLLMEEEAANDRRRMSLEQDPLATADRLPPKSADFGGGTASPAFGQAAISPDPPALPTTAISESSQKKTKSSSVSTPIIG